MKKIVVATMAISALLWTNALIAEEPELNLEEGAEHTFFNNLGGGFGGFDNNGFPYYGNSPYGANSVGYGATDALSFGQYGHYGDGSGFVKRPNFTGYGSGGYGDPATYNRTQYCNGRQMDQSKCMSAYPDSKVSQWRFIKSLGWRKMTNLDAARFDWWNFKGTQRPWGSFFDRTWY